MLPPNESITVGPAKASSLVSDESIQEYNDKLCMRINSGYAEPFPSCTAHRIRPDSLDDDDSRKLAPVLEWPGPQPSEGSNAAAKQGSKGEGQGIGGAGKDDECEITSSLWLVNNVEDDANVACADISRDSFQYMDDTDCVRKCISRPQTGWDPANASPYIRWDPYRNIVCVSISSGSPPPGLCSFDSYFSTTLTLRPLSFSSLTLNNNLIKNRAGAT